MVVFKEIVLSINMVHETPGLASSIMLGPTASVFVNCHEVDWRHKNDVTYLGLPVVKPSSRLMTLSWRGRPETRQ
jgi:hypothetical protein